MLHCQLSASGIPAGGGSGFTGAVDILRRRLDAEYRGHGGCRDHGAIRSRLKRKRTARSEAHAIESPSSRVRLSRGKLPPIFRDALHKVEPAQLRPLLRALHVLLPARVFVYTVMTNPSVATSSRTSLIRSSISVPTWVRIMRRHESLAETTGLCDGSEHAFLHNASLTYLLVGP